MAFNGARWRVLACVPVSDDGLGGVQGAILDLAGPESGPSNAQVSDRKHELSKGAATTAPSRLHAGDVADHRAAREPRQS
mgnify:CR=1 FL=1